MAEYATMPIIRSTSMLLVAWLCAACGGEHPSAPDALTGSSSAATSSAPPPQAPPSQPTLQTFSLSGTVVDERGRPISGAPVLVNHYKPGCCSVVTVLTDAAGRYAVEFESNPAGSHVARVELRLDAYDWTFRDIGASSAPIVADFHLRRVTRIMAGEAAEIFVTPQNGNCLNFLYAPCGRLRVTVPADGELTIDGAVIAGAVTGPHVVVCCVNGHEQGGNPITIRVTGGVDVWVEVGQERGTPTSVEGRVRVTTSFRPS